MRGKSIGRSRKAVVSPEGKKVGLNIGPSEAVNTEDGRPEFHQASFREYKVRTVILFEKVRFYMLASGSVPILFPSSASKTLSK